MVIKRSVVFASFFLIESVALAQEHDHAHEHEHEEHDSQHSDEDHDDHHSEGEHADHHTDHDHHSDDDHSDDDHDQAAGSAHVHGSWSLFAAVDASTLSVTLTGPLYDVLGFESVPGTPEQKDAVDTLISNLSQADALVTPDPRGECDIAEPVDVSLPDGFTGSETDGTTDHEHGDDHSEDHHDDGDEHHDEANVDVTLTYNCGAPDRISSVEVGMFTAYPSIETMDAVFLGELDQIAARLNPDDPMLELK
ncbi:MAG: DUF2796 domain-containing protein [Pseudomonadota bacterium]